MNIEMEKIIALTVDIINMLEHHRSRYCTFVAWRKWDKIARRAARQGMSCLSESAGRKAEQYRIMYQNTIKTEVISNGIRF